LKDGDRLRHARTGTIGVAVQKDDQWFVRYKQGQVMSDALYEPDTWRPEFDEPQPPNKGQRGMTAFEADQAFCRVMGRYGQKRIWASLKREEMRQWMDPDHPPIPEYTQDDAGNKTSQQDRRRLYLFVHRAMMPRKERERAED